MEKRSRAPSEAIKLKHFSHVHVPCSPGIMIQFLPSSSFVPETNPPFMPLDCTQNGRVSVLSLPSSSVELYLPFGKYGAVARTCNMENESEVNP